MARKAAKRETVSPRGDKRYVRRGEAGRFEESDDQGKSLSQDRKRKAKKTAAKGQGDRGDRRTSAAKRKTTGAKKKTTGTKRKTTGTKRKATGTKRKTAARGRTRR